MDEMTPTTDKVLTTIGLIIAVLNLSDLSTLVGILVGIATLVMIIPRGVMNWKELRAANRSKKERIEEARKLLSEAQAEADGLADKGEFD
jgi:hypothetical protein